MTTGTDYAARFGEEEARRSASNAVYAAFRDTLIKEATDDILTAKVAFAAGKLCYPVRGTLGRCRHKAKFCSPVSVCLEQKNVSLLERLAAEHGVFIDWRFESQNTTHDLGTMYHYEAYVVPTAPRPPVTGLRKLRAWLFG